MRRSVGGPPAAALALAGAGLLVFLVLPVTGLVSRVPWGDVGDVLASPEVGSAVALSLVCSLSATAISIVVGVPLAWVLARRTFPGRELVRRAAMVPLVLPPVVGGVALLFAFGRNGVPGRWLADVGVRLPFTTAGAILAGTFVAMPFLVLTVEAAIRSLDRGYEETAATLGASRWRTFFRVTLPAIGPSVATGAALTWARALGEFGATITFAGNVPGRTQTLPLAVYLALERRPEAALVLSVLMLVVSIGVLAVLGPRTRPSLR